jgi:hypothetical protein
MARKRGGLAGIWDRNKKILKPVASAAGFMFGGPAGSAAVNGAISGFDRPGKGGIGFDVKRGAVGAAKGYLGGRLAGGLGIKGGGGMDSLRGMFSGGLKQAGQRVLDTAGKGAWEVGSAVGRVGDWAARDPKNLLALGQTAVGGLNAYGAAQQNNQMNQQMRLEERQAADRERMRALLLPYFTSALGGR